MQAVAAKEKAVQELTDTKKKFVQMTRRRQAEHASKVGPGFESLILQQSCIPKQTKQLEISSALRVLWF